VRILILNWRDLKNPRAGGAEVLTHEIAKRLVSRGDHVEWFSATYPGAPSTEEVDGVRIVRGGRQWTVHWQAFMRYRGNLRARFDVVVDEVNTVPFFTPLWADIPVFMLIYQLAREVWWYESPFPINALGYLLEPIYLRCYRRTPVFTISASTSNDLGRLGFSGPVTIVPIGVDASLQAVGRKAAVPTFVYVGRVSRSKRIGDILLAFANFRKAEASARLWVIGQGPPNYVRKLKMTADRLGLRRTVSFFGQLSAAEKNRRLGEAHVLLMTSVREGWGMVVSEANACGTPAVVYDVPGLRDSVRNGDTGLVVGATPEELTAGMLLLWRDKDLYRRLADQALAASHSASFDTTASIIRKEIEAGLLE